MSRKPLHTRWSEKDDEILRGLWKQPLAVALIARRMGKSAATVNARAKALRLPAKQRTRRRREASSLYFP